MGKPRAGAAMFVTAIASAKVVVLPEVAMFLQLKTGPVQPKPLEVEILGIASIGRIPVLFKGWNRKRHRSSHRAATTSYHREMCINHIIIILFCCNTQTKWSKQWGKSDSFG